MTKIKTMKKEDDRHNNKKEDCMIRMVLEQGLADQDSEELTPLIKSKSMT